MATWLINCGNWVEGLLRNWFVLFEFLERIVLIWENVPPRQEILATPLVDIAGLFLWFGSGSHLVYSLLRGAE